MHWCCFNCVGSLKVLNNVTLWAPNLSYFYVSPKDCIFDDSFCRKSYLYFSKESYSCEKWMETIGFFSFSFPGNISLLKFFVMEIKENSLSNPKRFTHRKRCSNFYEIRYGAWSFSQGVDQDLLICQGGTDCFETSSSS